MEEGGLAGPFSDTLIPRSQRFQLTLRARCSIRLTILLERGSVGSASVPRAQDRRCAALEDSPVIRRRVAWSWPASPYPSTGATVSGANDAKRRFTVAPVEGYGGAGQD